MSDRLQKLLAATEPVPMQISIGEILVRPVELVDMMAQGVIPVTLLQDMMALSRMMGEGDQTDESKLMEGLAKIPEAVPSINAVVKVAVVDPLITDTGEEGKFPIDRLRFSDRMTIFAWANSDAESLRPFRQ